MTYIEITGVILMAAAGAGAAWYLRQKSNIDILQILLSFTGAYLLAVTVLHLLPEVFAHDHDSSADRSAYYVLIGFFVQLLIVQFTRGLEHGHLHLHDHQSSGYLIGVVSGLSLHALLEGVPLSGHGVDHTHADHLYYAILLHKLPETFSLATVLFFSVRKSLYAWLILAVFGLLTPIGSLLGAWVAEAFLEAHYYWLLAVVCGTFIHISTTIIFESGGKAHRISLLKFASLLAGVAIALLGMVS